MFFCSHALRQTKNYVFTTKMRGYSVIELNKRSTPVFLAQFLGIYAATKASNKIQKKLLAEFRDNIKSIKNWNDTMVTEKYEHFKSKVIDLESLLKKIDISIDPIVFFYNCSLNIARELWKNPYLCYDIKVSNVDILRNRAEIEKIIHSMIEYTLVQTSEEFENRHSVVVNNTEPEVVEAENEGNEENEEIAKYEIVQSVPKQIIVEDDVSKDEEVEVVNNEVEVVNNEDDEDEDDEVADEKVVDEIEVVNGEDDNVVNAEQKEPKKIKDIKVVDILPQIQQNKRDKLRLLLEKRRIIKKKLLEDSDESEYSEPEPCDSFY